KLTNAINRFKFKELESVVIPVILEEKKKKKKVQHITPTYFALFFEQKYGQKLKSVIKLLWIEQQNVLQAEDISQPLVYKPSEPVISNKSVDYIQFLTALVERHVLMTSLPEYISNFMIKGRNEITLQTVQQAQSSL
ncbi:hypothetical protein ALC57_14155, partial [Trachymyrmex cornetzi]